MSSGVSYFKVTPILTRILWTTIYWKPEKVDFTWMHNVALENKSAVEKAIIKVENINGPVLLVSGLHDQWWPSAKMSRLVMKRLKDNNFPHLKSSNHIELDTDHFVFREYANWKKMVDRLDGMVKYRHTYSSNSPGLSASKPKTKKQDEV